MTRILLAALLVLAALPLAPSASAAPCSGPPAEYAACMAGQSVVTAVILACDLSDAAFWAAADLYNQYTGNDWEPHSECVYP